MDPYEILGIRPNAGRDEIELAYKGRRSQYHPDRYAQSDAQTQAWATDKMQAVNQAYAALKDPEERARFDQAQANRSARPEPSPRPQPPPMPKATLRDALQGLEFSAEPFERVFVAPHIPLKKLRGALASYGEDVRPQDVVALIDDTVFGGAKEGMLITENEILFKAIFESVSRIRLEMIEEINAEGNRIYTNGYEFAKLNIPERRDVQALFKRISTYLKQRAVEPASQPATSEGRKGGYEDPDQAAAKQLFSRLRQGFFKQLESDIQHEAATARSRSDRVSAELVRQLMQLSGVLERFAQASGAQLSGSERSFLSSDPMRVELLIFAVAIAERLLSDEAGMEDEQIAEVIHPVIARTLLPYIADVEGIGERRTLRSVARPLEELEESMFFQEFRRRWRRYGVVFNKTTDDIIEAFDHSLRHPAAFHALDIPLRVQLNAFAEVVVDRVLDTDAMPEFIAMLFKKTEDALVSVLDKA